MFCSKCGAENPEGAQFCVKCGQKVESVKEDSKSKEALEWLQKAKVLKDEGIARDDKEKIEESLSSFEKAIELNPKNGDLWYEKGIALGLLERFEDAVEDFETAVKLDPENEGYKEMLRKAKESIAEKSKKEEIKAQKPSSIAVEIKPHKELSDFKIIRVIERLMDRKTYQNLIQLEADVVKELEKEGFTIDDEKTRLIKDLVLKHGHTGKFAIDDMIARKLGGGKRAAIIVSLVLLISAGVFTEIIIPMVGERITNNPPVGQIVSPENNKVITAGQDIVFSGTAEDKEDEQILGSNFIWSSDIDGEIGSGSSISISTLSPGTHTVTLSVKDSNGASDTETVVLSVIERKVLHELTVQNSVSVNGEDIQGFIRVWEPLIDETAPNKGWLEIENPYYSIRINLDRSYYMLYDKALSKDLLVFNEKVENEMETLCGSDIGYADLDGNNQVPFSTTCRHDSDGIGRHTILFEDRNSGFLLVNTEGWDFQVVDPTKGYDTESEVMFGVFADKPYFFDATEVNNLQTLGTARDNSLKSPNEIIKSWVISGDYDSASIKGGDPEHLNKEVYEEFYNVVTLTGAGRKPWHSGSAEISKMFPDHVIVGSRLGGGIIFSLPQGKFRWDDAQDVFGGQVAAEFLIGLERPQKAVAFSVDPVSRETFLYDAKDFATIPGYAESLGEICERYSLACIGTLDAKDFETKRFAYVISLTSNWYDAGENQVKDEVWAKADSALGDFTNYEGIIYQQLSSTKPLYS